LTLNNSVRLKLEYGEITTKKYFQNMNIKKAKMKKMKRKKKTLTCMGTMRTSISDPRSEATPSCW